MYNCFLKAINFNYLRRIDVTGFVTGFGSVDWKKTHEAAGKTAVVVTNLLKNGATCVGKTIMDEFGFGYPFLSLTTNFIIPSQLH